MDQLHHQKANSGLEFPVAALNPEEIMRLWQTRTSKLLHAQERIAQGMAAAMRAQLRYGQEFMVSHMNIMQWEVADAAHLSEQARKDIENFAALIKEVSGEIRSGFTEAGELLEVKLPHTQQAAPAPAAEETAKPVAAHTEQKAEPPAAEAAAPVEETSQPVAAHPTEDAEAPPAKAAAPKPAPAAAKAAPASIKRPASRTKPTA